jgi:hypothetical protein
MRFVFAILRKLLRSSWEGLSDAAVGYLWLLPSEQCTRAPRPPLEMPSRSASPDEITQILQTVQFSCWKAIKTSHNEDKKYYTNQWQSHRARKLGHNPEDGHLEVHRLQDTYFWTLNKWGDCRCKQCIAFRVQWFYKQIYSLPFCYIQISGCKISMR